jgi:hypothetical protein
MSDSMTPPRSVTCLLSHKCGSGICDVPAKCPAEARCLACTLREALRFYAVELLVDPMRPGDLLQTRMETVEFDALLFIISEQSLQSAPCAVELLTATRRNRPIFSALLEGRLPENYRNRLCMNVKDLRTTEGASQMAAAIKAHVAVSQCLEGVTSAFPDVSRRSVSALFHVDPSTVAEYLDDIERAAAEAPDEYTRAWLVWTIERTHAPGASALIGRLARTERHPYVIAALNRSKYGVREKENN